MNKEAILKRLTLLHVLCLASTLVLTACKSTDDQPSKPEQLTNAAQPKMEHPTSEHPK